MQQTYAGMPVFVYKCLYLERKRCYINYNNEDCTFCMVFVLFRNWWYVYDFAVAVSIHIGCICLAFFLCIFSYIFFCFVLTPFWTKSVVIGFSCLMLLLIEVVFVSSFVFGVCVVVEPEKKWENLFRAT